MERLELNSDVGVTPPTCNNLFLVKLTFNR